MNGWRRGGIGGLECAPAGSGGSKGFAHGDICGERRDRTGEACGMDGWIVRGAGPGGGWSAATEVCCGPEVGAGCSFSLEVVLLSTQADEIKFSVYINLSTLMFLKKLVRQVHLACQSCRICGYIEVIATRAL